MGKSLVIVESPAKIKTLKKFFGNDFIFESSLGHIRDLPSKGFGIDVEHDFEPQYEVLEEKEAVVQKLRQAAKQCDMVYLSPDPDREGEAIAWHIAAILPKNQKVRRITFNSITKEAVLEAFNHPRDIDIALVDAQQARRLLDRIVGYKISPILARRIQKGRRNGSASAGRVQSVALKFVVDREVEIDVFTAVEYWNINASFHDLKVNMDFDSYLHSVDGKKIEKEAVKDKDVTLVSNEKTAHELHKQLESGTFTITKVDKKEKKRNPVPPFITSTLQQEASRHHSFSAAKTMNVAQSLYEGVELGTDEAEGLITYMRTDSVNIADEAMKKTRVFIEKTYGKEYLPATPRSFSSKKSAQEAHEAIRPTNLNNPPEAIEHYLTIDQFRLYSLIWKRALASQMQPAIYDTVSIDISSSSGHLLRTTGSIIKFFGFLKVYEEKSDDDEAEEIIKQLPDLEVGNAVDLNEVKTDRHFTKPPPRFTEASLVKELEKSGIGRPSTYATIMSKIQNREYTIKEKGRLIPTDLGKVIAQMLETNFRTIMNVQFTADMENELEKIAENKKEWKTLIKEFWKEFIPIVEKAEKDAFVPKILTDIDCPKCESHKLMKIWSRNKYFYGCADYPTCDYSAPLEELNFDKGLYDDDFDWEQKCPKCSKNMILRHGRFGPFLGCTDYPECRGIINIPKKGEELPKESDLPPCPAIGCDGKITIKRSRFGKYFFACSTFPDCNVIANTLEDLKAKYIDHPKTAYVKKTKKSAKKTAKKGTKKAKKAAKKSTRKPIEQPPKKLSPELQEVVGEEMLSRPQVVKKVWEYIKANQLQDENNKRLIVPDEKLAKVFGQTEAMDMFKMTKVISSHILKD